MMLDEAVLRRRERLYEFVRNMPPSPDAGYWFNTRTKRLSQFIDALPLTESQKQDLVGEIRLAEESPQE